MEKNSLIVFARNPEWGKVKSRMASRTSKNFAFHCYHYLLTHTLATAMKVQGKKSVFYSDFIPEDQPDSLFENRLQQGADLGERLQNAFTEALQKYEKVIVIGSDCLELDEETIEKAFSYLDQVKIVLGPAHDGGFYLLGMKEMNPSLFLNKSWGTSSVFRETMEDINKQRLSYALLKPLHDVDFYEDLPSFVAEKIHDISHYSRP